LCVYSPGAEDINEVKEELSEVKSQVQIKIVNLEEKVNDAIGQLNESRSEKQDVEPHKERKTRKCNSTKSAMKEGRNDGTENKNRIESCKAEAATTSQPVNSRYEDERSKRSVREKREFFDNIASNNADTPLVHGQRPPARRESIVRRLSRQLKRKPSQQSKIT